MHAVLGIVTMNNGIQELRRRLNRERQALNRENPFYIRAARRPRLEPSAGLQHSRPCPDPLALD